MTPMKYALIGCGRIAPNHIKAALSNNLEIVALCVVMYLIYFIFFIVRILKENNTYQHILYNYKLKLCISFFFNRKLFI